MSDSTNLQGPGSYFADNSPDLGEDWESGRHIHGSSRRRWFEHAHVWRPPTDVFESEAGYVIRIELAGMRSADFSVTLEAAGCMSPAHGRMRSSIGRTIRWRSISVPSAVTWRSPARWTLSGWKRCTRTAS